MAEEESVSASLLATALDLRLQVQIGLLVELPPEAPQCQIGATVAPAACRGTPTRSPARCSRGTSTWGCRAGRSWRGWARGARGRSGTAAATRTASTWRNRVAWAAVLPTMGVARTLKGEEPA